MVKLVCTIIGVRSAFPVDIDATCRCKGPSALPDEEGRTDLTFYYKLHPLWKLNKPELFDPSVMFGEEVVHILVVYPGSVKGCANVTLAGPNDVGNVNLDLTEDLLNPQILDEESLGFQLVGRDKAISEAAKCFTDIIRMAQTKAGYRMNNVVPVCSGISGRGKREYWKKDTAYCEKR
ncbi:Crinkler (CRN) [Phytophthora megakarya]|uniref:Crinkler (CRN) n=1 Tax=Phytophthora megakarya TaxID=4795 RepID=A0A225WIQ3_9STRA|nr:Crinkler (CRN) [Phytophthora megakarya]